MLLDPRTVRGKVAILAMGAALVPTVVLLCAITIEKGRLARQIDVELTRMVRDDLGGVARDMYSLCQTQNAQLTEMLKGNLNVASQAVQRKGAIRVSSANTREWNAVDQTNGSSRTVALPNLSIGGETIEANRDANTRTPVVDEVAAQVGGTCTIFQRMNAQGDMLRIATNVIDKNGARAVGTYIPAAGADGKPNPVVASVLRGETYTGRALVVDNWCLAAYRPLRDDNNEIVGMLYVGVRQENLPQLRQAFLERAVGQSGYVFVLGGSGTQKGQYIISKDGKRDGENIWEAKDADGQPFIQTMVTEAVKSSGNAVSFQRYAWKNQGDSKARMKLTAVSYYGPWDWVIGVGAYEDEFMEANRQAAAALAGLTRAAVICGVLAVVAMAMLAVVVLNTVIGRPIARLTAVANRLAVGDVDVAIDVRSQDEIGVLARAMDSMVANVKDQASAAQKIEAGDLEVEVKPRSEQDILSRSLAQVVKTLRDLVAEIGAIGKAGREGRLSVRGDAQKFRGGYHDIIEGLNGTLDAILNPINEAAGVLERVAKRDMTARVKGEYQGDHAKIKQSLNQAVVNLDEGLQQVAVAVEQVASAAAQIGSGSQALAQGASEQASSLEEVSSSLQEMNSMTRQNASSAKEAKSLAEGTRTGANKGLESMNRLSGAMERIKSSSDSTAKIVKTIDEIAFQTNLLALNAAVEAARAGDAGKGFAVVAEEVRNLAMRSAEAAKNTANMIEESVRNADSGVELNAEVLLQLQEITEQANKVGAVMTEIAASSDQQTTGVEQISTAVEQMNQVTQQNAAGSEESASAAEELAGQAEELRSLVGQFHLSAAAFTQKTAARRTHAAPPAVQPLPFKDARHALAERKAKAVRAHEPKSAKVLDPDTVIPFHNEDDAAVMGGF